MNDNLLVSVIMPAYNHELYIKNSIDSVINQTYKNIEFLIVDDGSSDNTLKIIMEQEKICTERFTRFEYYHQDNHGTCYTLNKLLNLSKGDYILILASDDVLAEDTIENEANILNKFENVSLVVGINKIIDADGNVCFWDEERNNVYDENDAKWLDFSDFISNTTKVNFNDSQQFGRYEELLKCNHIANGYLIRRSIFDLIGFFTTDAPLEDYWLMLQISKYAYMYHISQVTFYYRWHGANTANQKEKMNILVDKTIKYEEVQFVKQCSDKCLESYKFFREKYLINAIRDNKNLNIQLLNSNAHVEQLLESERKLKADNQNKQNEIIKLTQNLSMIKNTNYFKIAKIFYKNFNEI